MVVLLSGPRARLSIPVSALASCLLLTSCVSFESGSVVGKNGSRAPVAWGMRGGAKNCIIFREYSKTSVGFAVVVAGMSSHAELEVIDSGGYEMSKKVWVEDGNSMNELQRLAEEDMLRFVKVQDGYTPDELNQARTLCGKGQGSQLERPLFGPSRVSTLHPLLAGRARSARASNGPRKRPVCTT